MNPDRCAARRGVAAVAAAVIAQLLVEGAAAQVAQPVPIQDLTQAPLPPDKLSVVQRDEMDNKVPPIRLGSFVLLPSLLTGEAFERNIFSSHSGVQSDFITHIRPEFDLLSNWGLDALALHAEADVAQYARFSSENAGDVVLESDGRLDLLRGAYLTIGAGYQNLHELRSSPDSIEAVMLAGGAVAKNPTEYALETGHFAYVDGPGLTKFELDGSVVNYQFSNEPTTNGGLAINGDRNRTEFTVTPKLGYEFAPGFQTYVQLSGDRRQYAAESDATAAHLNRSSSGYAIGSGVDFDLGFPGSGTFYAGYQSQIYDDPRLSAIDGVYFGGSLLWNVTDFSSVRARLSRMIEDTIILGSPGFWATEADLSLEHELDRDLLLTGTLTYINSDYQGTSLVNNRYVVHGDAVWRLTRNVDFAASAEWLRQNSDRALQAFGQEMAQLSIKLRL